MFEVGENVRRVCLIATLAGPRAVSGGVWQAVTNQASALVSAGVDVSVVAGWLGSPPGALSEKFRTTLVPVRPILPGCGIRGLVGRGWSEAIREGVHGVDVAHVHLCRDFLTTRAARIARRAGVPVVAQSHGMLAASNRMSINLFDRIYGSKVFAEIYHYIALSEWERVALADLGIPANRVHIAPNGVASPSVRWGANRSRQVLFVGRLHPVKQVMVLAEAIANLRRQGVNVTALVVGPDHGDLRRLRDYIDQGGLGEGIAYAGVLSREEIDAELSRSAVFASPSQRESFGLAIVEAMAVGTPVIVTTNTPLSQIIEQNVAGVVIDPTSTNFSRAIEAVLLDSVHAGEMAERGRSLFERNWSLSEMTERLLGVYNVAVEDLKEHA